MKPASGPDLRDIHLPPAPSWWPPAPGWWLLAALLIAALVAAGWWVARRWRERRWRRSIAAELALIAATHRTPADGPRLAAGISDLLRRATLLLDRRAAALPGEAWLSFLDARVGGEEFQHGAGRVLIDAPYRRSVDIDAPALVKLARRWLARALPTPLRTAQTRGASSRRWRRTHDRV